MQQLARPAAEGFVATKCEGIKLYGAVCLVPKRLQHLCSCRPVKLVHVQQPGDPRLHWMPIAVDGAASYVHCTLGGISSPKQLSSWCRLRGSDDWVTLCVAAQEVGFGEQSSDASKAVF